MVWEIADRMWGQRRKDIIEECVRLGIAYNTARTQYQAFYKVKSQVINQIYSPIVRIIKKD
jgi:hypothetical protein